jgi:hypothetical protein
MTTATTPPREGPALLVALVAAPLLVALGKLPFLPTAPWLERAFTLADLSPRLQHHAEHMMFVPLSALVVCFFRLTLGVPVLSLFRPILTAVAFRVIGIPLGLAVLAVAMAGVVLVKPLLRRSHYYVRVPLVLSLAAAGLVVPLALDRWLHLEALREIAYFPLINLALMCEGFTKILNDKGLRAALWPTTGAVVSAVVIALLAAIPGALRLTLRFPEVLVLQAGLVLAIGRHLDLQLLAGWNPFLPRPTPQAASAPVEAAPRLHAVSE